jgi:lipoate-protein ligase A
MDYCDVIVNSPAENLAIDEVLLDLCEEGAAAELLRVWEPASHFVVVGYGNHVATEVNLPFCRAKDVPVLRRCTGGGTVVMGPGVLNYSLILRFDASGPLGNISSTNAFVLDRHRMVLSSLVDAPVEIKGQTDLAINGLKFCGNAQRRRKRSLIFHGSFLLDLDINMVEKTLPMPSKQPQYRHNRSHSEFLMNLKLPPDLLKAALARSWGAAEPAAAIPDERIAALVDEKYGNDGWNLKF